MLQCGPKLPNIKNIGNEKKLSRRENDIYNIYII